MLRQFASSPDTRRFVAIGLWMVEYDAETGTSMQLITHKRQVAVNGCTRGLKTHNLVLGTNRQLRSDGCRRGSQTSSRSTHSHLRAIAEQSDASTAQRPALLRGHQCSEANTAQRPALLRGQHCSEANTAQRLTLLRG